MLCSKQAPRPSKTGRSLLVELAAPKSALIPTSAGPARGKRNYARRKGVQLHDKQDTSQEPQKDVRDASPHAIWVRLTAKGTG